MEKRKKEIAVRKVMGASSGKIAYIMYIDFVVLVVLAFVVAAPVGYYFFDTWLNQFAYRIDMSLWIFLASFVSILVVSGLTVSYQTIKASRLNPATVLKNE
jgi:putative ABC transport system permease protein